MSALWPATLPQALQVSDLEETFPDMLLRSEVDAGPAIVRRRFTAAPQPIAGSLKMTRAQLALFYSFYVDTIGGGSLAFEWKHPRTAVTQDFRFTAPPAVRPYSPRFDDATDYWTVSMALETVPGSLKTGPTDPPGPGPGLFLPAHQFNDATGGLPSGLDPMYPEDGFGSVSGPSIADHADFTTVPGNTAGPPNNGGVGGAGGSSYGDAGAASMFTVDGGVFA